jgi:glycosyltransferase involved in cell wall biosynthesis
MRANGILVGHPYWGRSGAEVAAMWLLQALCQEYRVDVLTRGGWDLDDLNRCAGTSIQRGDLGSILYPPFTSKVNRAGGALWHALFLRYCRRLAPRYDICVTASRVVDWGRPAIHFLSDAAWNTELQRRFQTPEALLGAGLTRSAYFRVAKMIAGKSGRDAAREDTFVANSGWTASMSAEFCERPPVVIYPAVPANGVTAVWEERADEFLCLGRISPEKRIERVIAIMDQLRAMGHKVRLHLAGGGEGGFYERQIQRLCDERREWMTSHGAVYGEAKKALLGLCRFGLSARDDEAFGIATAEMAAAGILPFVPRTGGQCEIVREPDLIYEDIQDAALKIDAVLRSETRQHELHEAMLLRGQEFNPERFCTEVRALVSRVLDGR